MYKEFKNIPNGIRKGQWFCIVFKLHNCELFYCSDTVATPIIQSYLNDWQYKI